MTVPLRGRGRAGRSVRLAFFAVLASCSEASPPDATDTGGAGGEGICPNDLPDGDACASAVPSYGREVAAIMEQRCATCHYPGNTQSGDVFADYDDVYALRRTVLTRIYGCVMPPEAAPALTPDERRVLLQWLTCGAPDN